MKEIIFFLIGLLVGFFLCSVESRQAFYQIPKSSGPGYSVVDRDGVKYRWCVVGVKARPYWADMDSARSGLKR